jgi:hypothetical protein
VAASVPPDLHAPKRAYAVCFLVALAFFSCIVWLDHSGQWLLAGLVAAASSYTVMAVARNIIEGSDLPLFDLKHGSWAFLIGDAGLGLAVMAGSYTRNSHHWDNSSWGSSTTWAAVALIVGYGMGLGFHYVLDKGGYTKVRADALLYSPSKMAHDFVTYPALAGAMVYICVPVAFSSIWRYNTGPYLMMLAFLVWIVGVAHDASGLDVWKLHPVYDWKQHKVVPAPAPSSTN